MATKTFLFTISTTGHCFTVFLHSMFGFYEFNRNKIRLFCGFWFVLFAGQFLSQQLLLCLSLRLLFFHPSLSALSSHISAELAYSLTHWLKGPCWIFNEDCDTWTESDSHSCIHESSSLQHVLTSYKYCYKDDFYESLHAVCVLNHCHHTGQSVEGFAVLTLQWITAHSSPADHILISHRLAVLTLDFLCEILMDKFINNIKRGSLQIYK